MRTFIALNLPARERQKIHRAAKALRDQDFPVRWVDPESLHVTLKFLGEVKPDRLGRVEEVLDGVAAETERFTLTLAGFGAFPTIRRPRVIWLGVDATPELRCLKQDLEWGLSDCGFDTETRAFHPHLTLGRADPRGGAGDFRGLDELVAGLDLRVQLSPKSVDLMRSHLSRAGARYSVIRNAKLGGG